RRPRRRALLPRPPEPARAARRALLQVSSSVYHLHVVDLVKSYDGTNVIDGLDLDIEPGVCFGLLGPNGAGKTTTLRLCLGLTAPDSGTIAMLGLPIPARARGGH